MPKTDDRPSMSDAIPLLFTIEVDGREIGVRSHRTWRDDQRHIAQGIVQRATGYDATHNPTTPIAATQCELLEAAVLSA